MTDRDSKSKPQADRRQRDWWFAGLMPQNGDLGPYSPFDEWPGLGQPQLQPRDDWASAPKPEFIQPRSNRRESSGFEGLGQSMDVLQTETEGRLRFRFIEFAFRRRKYKSRS